MTLVEDVLSLPPGHTMTVLPGSQTAAAKPKSYWSIAEPRLRDEAMGGQVDRDAETWGHVEAVSVNGNGHPIRDSVSASHQVRKLLEQSVRRHLIADVPVGVFLSSGIDSTSLAALASRQVAGVHTFTVAFPEAEYSEVEQRAGQRKGLLLQRVGRQVGARQQHDRLLDNEAQRREIGLGVVERLFVRELDRSRWCRRSRARTDSRRARPWRRAPSRSCRPRRRCSRSPPAGRAARKGPRPECGRRCRTRCPRQTGPPW